MKNLTVVRCINLQFKIDVSELSYGTNPTSYPEVLQVLSTKIFTFTSDCAYLGLF
jgi:hypothetical protein